LPRYRRANWPSDGKNSTMPGMFCRLRLFMDLIDCLINSRHTITLASPGYTGAGTEQDSKRMQIACRYIMENFCEEISHEALAAKVHLAPSSFSRLFKRVTRKTCTAYVNEIRLGHACRLLIETNHSIPEIAFTSGFHNLSNFNRRFRERYQCSPREYRRQHMQTKASGR
jgi:AraC-like DNA-binding protein